YENNDEETWHWFESRMTYCNSVLPWAMLSAYEVLQEKRYLEIGLESLDFLSQTTFRQNHFHPIGCNGWLKKGEMAAPFDQQPVEACEMLLVCLKAFELSKDEKYIRWAKRCLGWYTGENSAQISLIDPDTGGCMDGITPIGPNCNEGAESLVSWLIARLAWEKAIPDFKRRGDQIEL
ncbi:MAG TPA: glycosyltransferase, partial [Clostridia bacterium]|nr:glycosyltransferase [Clostridia bacterium]